LKGAGLFLTETLSKLTVVDGQRGSLGGASQTNASGDKYR
jgi:hypothetical protein